MDILNALRRMRLSFYRRTRGISCTRTVLSHGFLERSSQIKGGVEMKAIVVMSLAASVVLALSACEMYKPENKTSFFVTSAGSGKGADLGGLAGADRHCQDLAGAVGAGGKTWHAYLSAAGVDGRAIAGDDDTTCKNWTTSAAGAAMLGHHDRQGLRDDEPSKSWNSSHLSRPSKAGDPGCSQVALQGTGGNGLYYCFAVN